MHKIYTLVSFDTIINIQTKNGSRRIKFLKSNKGTDLRPIYLSQFEKRKINGQETIMQISFIHAIFKTCFGNKGHVT